MNLVNSMVAGIFLLSGNAHGAPAEKEISDGELFGKNAGFTAFVVRKCAATPAERARVKNSGRELIDALIFRFKDGDAIKRGYVSGTFIAIKKFPPPEKPSRKACAEALLDEQETLNWADQ